MKKKIYHLALKKTNIYKHIQKKKLNILILMEMN